MIGTLGAYLFAYSLMASFVLGVVWLSLFISGAVD